MVKKGGLTKSDIKQYSFVYMENKEYERTGKYDNRKYFVCHSIFLIRINNNKFDRLPGGKIDRSASINRIHVN